MLNIPHSRPLFGQPFETAAAKVVHSGILAQGRETKALELIIIQLLRHRHVLAVDSGTSALMLAIRSLTKNKQHARIGIPSYACASLLFAVKAAGAQPVFMDCNQHLCLDKSSALETAKTLDVLVLVHPFGMADPLAAETFPCPVIEDIAQSVGATIDGKAVGTFAAISIGSLYATKPWGGAYGGFISCQSQSHLNAIKQMCDPDQAALNLPYAGHHQLSNLHATMAIQRINIADREQEQRQLLAQKYDNIITTTSATVIRPATFTSGNHFRYIIRCEQKAETVIARFNQLGIDAKRPVRQPLHQTDSEAVLPHTLDAWQHCVSLPMLANMNEAEYRYIQQNMEQCLRS